MRLGVLALLGCACADAAAPPELASDASSSTDVAMASETSTGSDAPADRRPSDVPPFVMADRYRTVTDAELSIAAADGVLHNDAPGVHVLAHDAVTAAGGALAIADDGALHYQPPVGFGGCDAATYSIVDAAGVTASARIVLAVAHPRHRPSPMTLADLQRDGETLALAGELASDSVGTTVASVGDVDGDGLGDVLVGAPAHGANGRASSGRVYLVRGATMRGAVGLETIAAGDGGFAIDGEAPEVRAGEALAAGGDVDGDGRADLLVGAPQTNLGNGPMGDNVGRAFVIFGSDRTQPLDLAELVARGAGQSFTGEKMGDAAGAALARVGDVDGDGRSDFLIGAPLAGDGETRPGRSYLVLGRAGAGSWRLDQRLAQGTAFVLDGEAQDDRSGSALAGLGDIDGDGVPELAIAAPSFDGDGIDRGRVYVVRGSVALASRSLASIAAGEGGFAIDGEADLDAAGAAVAGVGDVDGDGRDDFAIAAPGHDDARGRIYVVTDASSFADGDGGFVIDGEQPGDSIAAVARAGDLDGDGLDDVLVGAFRAGEGGRAYVVWGGAIDRVALGDVADGEGGFAIAGAAGELTGRAIAGGDDLDGDGVAELVLGSVGANDRGDYSGRVDRIDGRAAACE